ncbi:MAG: transcription termination/antitermination NusG family protein [Pyrinomonadaceae bacterium]
MSGTFEQGNIPRWYAIYSHPKQEDRAEFNLRAWGLETFNPKLKEVKHNQFTGAPIAIVKSLFPRYLFAKFSAAERLHKVCFTRGVNSVVHFGSGPVPVKDEIIDIIKSRVGEDGFVSIDQDFKTGEKVVIKDGPFRDFVGVFDRKIKHTDRVRILLEAVCYESHLIIEREYVSKVAHQ